MGSDVREREPCRSPGHPGAHLVVTLVDPVTQAEQVALVSPPGAPVLQVPPPPGAQTRSRWVGTHQHTMVVSDLAGEAAADFIDDALLRRRGIRSAVYVPLRVGSAVLGTLRCTGGRPRGPPRT